MPRRALRCSVELQIHAITCPGVYLPHRDDVYLSIHLFGEHRKTQLISPTFPLLFHERFRIDKIFYAAFEPSHVASSLEIEPITIELIQLSGAYGRVLATYTTSAKDFLYPYPSSTSNSYGTRDRDVLMDRSIEFPGISPKLEFSTKTKITETSAPTLDIYDDLLLVRALDDEPSYRMKSARRSRSRTRSPRRNRPKSANRGSSRSQRYRRSTVASACRCRSASPDRLVGRMSRLGLDDEFEYYDDEPKPPFVVRHVDSNKLIGRTPGTIGPNERRRRSRSAGRTRAAQVYGPGSSVLPFKTYRIPITERSCTLCRLYRRYLGKRYPAHSRFRHTGGHYNTIVTRHKAVFVGYASLDDDYVVRGRTSLIQPMTSRNYSYYSDEDRVGYDDDYIATKYGRRIRAASPVSYRRPLSERFDDGLTPRYSDHISYSVDHALRRNRYDNPARIHPSYTKSYLDQELEDLKVDLELARTRRAIEDEEWDRRRMFPGISRVPHHRDQFNHHLYNSYSDMYATKTRPFYS